MRNMTKVDRDDIAEQEQAAPVVETQEPVYENDFMKKPDRWCGPCTDIRARHVPTVEELKKISDDARAANPPLMSFAEKMAARQKVHK